ncbi:hypothetical protein C4B60_05810 [Jeotgalibacillus proteolyticus]|uniref:Uncharacterized protein n=1 Tax=Jeotgalibacillus proteolyticus TaxID=2082395 RepID=A0A2S5GFT5_9BACL|nr:hypothetical protein C4B60_05810 [Jeotgalibacillus proteolyticus]
MNKTYINDLKEWEEDFSFYYEIKVRFSETDLFGHLNNTVAFIYFEQARIEFLKAIGFMQEWLKKDSETIPVVADLQCDFLQQVYFDETLKIYVKAASVGGSSVDIHYRAVNNKGKTVLTGRGTMVQILKATGKSKPWEEHQKNKLLNTNYQHN